MNPYSDKYVEIAVGHPSNRGVVIPAKDIITYQKKHSHIALFRSFYFFDDELNDHFKTRKTIRNFKGKCYLSQIIIDIDKGYDTDDTCLKETIRIVNKLISQYDLDEKYIIPSFSGTGYHITIPDIFGFEPSANLPEKMKVNMAHYFPGTDTIYDKGRLIRVGFSPNEKVGNKQFKIPLTVEELLTLKAEDIIKLSQAPDRNRIKIGPIPEKLKLLKIIGNTPTTSQTGVAKGGGSNSSTSTITCVQNMWAKGPIKGTRHNILLRMISSFKRNGLPIDATKGALILWGNNMEPNEIEHLVDYVYEKDYQYGCHDVIMDKYCDKKCVFYNKKATGNDPLKPILTSEDMELKFKERVQSDISLSAFNLRNIIDIGVPYYCEPGELIIIQGPTGINKTAFLQNIVCNVKMETLWLSLEMSPELMYRRFIQIANNMTKEEVIANYKKPNPDNLSNIIQHIKLTSTSPKIESVKVMTKRYSPKILVVDTLDCIQVDSYSDLSKLETIILGLRAIASQENIIVMAVSHITKGDSRDGVLDAFSSKGSSSIPQKADKVIGIMGNPQQTKRIIKNLKARDEDHFTVECEVNMNTFRFVTTPKNQETLTFKEGE